METDSLQYVLITPARNEELLIERVFQSVLTQTKLPRLWVIVNDNSSDQTAQMVAKYARNLEWVVLLNATDMASRPFPSKVYAFNVGYDYVVRQRVVYDLIGNLDADISFGRDHFEFLLDRFCENPLLGVAGTEYLETGFHSARDTKAGRFQVAGQCQLFRKECFEAIGGYTPIEFFGEDLFAVTTARYLGWQTRAFTERVFMHHRPMGSRDVGLIMGKFNQGRKDYVMGNDLIWQSFRALYWTKNRPYVVGGIMLLMGFLWSFFRGDSIRLSPEVRELYRNEKYQRLSSFYKEILTELTGKTLSSPNQNQ